ncbi:hypothetical protein GCM10023085_33300 [Actinomadura viridis]
MGRVLASPVAARVKGKARDHSPRGPEGTPARIRLSHRLTVRAGAPSGIGVRANGGAENEVE